MKPFKFIIPVFLLFCFVSSAGVLKPENFRYSRELPGPLAIGKIYKIPLPGEVLNHTATDQRDIRIFSPDGKLIPFTILEERKAAVPMLLFHLTIRAFSTKKNITTLLLEVPAQRMAMRELFFATPNKNFKKTVSISISNDKKNWQPVANESIYDFSRNVDLRKTSVSFKPVKCRWVKIKMKDAELPAGNEAIQLNYKGLRFTSKGKFTPAFKIISVSGLSQPSGTGKTITDTMKITDFTIQTDAAGNSILSFSSGIPISALSIITDAPAFYRSVILKGERITINRHKIFLAKGSFYRFLLDGRTESRLTLLAHPSDTGNYTLIIHNGDNSALPIKALKLSWFRRNIFLIPETKTVARAILCYGNLKIPAAHFDVSRFIRQDNWQQHKTAVINPKTCVQNPDFQQAEKPWTPDFSRIALTLIVLMLIVVLSIWMWKLTRN
ncbi:MAG: DUF3999 domain-containing protein [Acidobacteria bacterium]|nr:DUF3999 domain-containing protein [Acidobacteriota bacterium]